MVELALWNSAQEYMWVMYMSRFGATDRHRVRLLRCQTSPPWSLAMLMYTRLALPVAPDLTPEDYTEEAAFYRDLFHAHGEGEMHSLLELGCRP
jgi:hypothetical protein